MKTAQVQIGQEIKNCLKNKYNVDIQDFEWQKTRKEFQGDITLVVFPLAKKTKTNPSVLANDLGDLLKNKLSNINEYSVVQGFLNLTLDDAYFANAFIKLKSSESLNQEIQTEKPAIMVEYASPNTNKPLHLGHVRNILLGDSIARILQATGRKVIRTQIVNDRGIHICKSMLAWKIFGEGKTPQTTNTKGDHFVGHYYVLFDKIYREQIKELIDSGLTEDQAKKQTPILLEAQQMLQQWEYGDNQVIELWETMNQWVYDGFEETYKALGISFDVYDYESNTYKLGKDIIFSGLEKGVFYKKDDDSIWIDLQKEKLDEKLVLRSDGTSVYITQDIGTAVKRFEEHLIDGLIYTVGNEQDYHFIVLFKILEKLGYPWAKNLHHLSYGMVDLPSGKMKSREGTVVDADDLIKTMNKTAQETSEALGKTSDYSASEKQNRYHVIGLGALKYFILKVDPKKGMLFDPAASIDFNGNTGPFIQYTYARIQSVLRKAESEGVNTNIESPFEIGPKEKEIIKQMLGYKEVIQSSAKALSPSLLANYLYDLAKMYNQYYQTEKILRADTDNQRFTRLNLSEQVGRIIQHALGLLGIQTLDRM